MGYSSWHRRPPRKYQGQPQWTVNDLYISPFTAKRLYNEDGDIHYEPIARNLNPTGIKVMDHYLRRLTEGKDVLRDFCPIYGLRTEDMDSLIYILTGMKGEDFRTAYQLRMADDLLRYTDLPIKDVARRSGLGSHSNFCVFIRRNHAQSPTQRRMILQQKNDAGRFKL